VIERLPTIGRDCGVEPKVLAKCRPAIDAQLKASATCQHLRLMRMTVTPAGACVKGRGVDKRRQEPNPAAEAALRRQFYDRVLAGTLSLGEAVRQMRRISRLTQPEFASKPRR